MCLRDVAAVAAVTGTVLAGCAGSGLARASDATASARVGPTSERVAAAEPSETAPEARAHHQIVYHAGDRRVYLLGGSTRRSAGYHFFDDLWAWDGSAWSRAGSLPFPRSSHGVAYHDRRKSLVLFGGGAVRTFATDSSLHEWDGTTWKTPGALADGSSEPAVCYDRARDRLVAFGGWDANNEFSGTTWEWTGEAAVEHSVVGPAPRAGHALVWDPVRERCMLFGGRSAESYLADTWEWTGAGWRRLNVVGPSARWFFGAATDNANRRVVLFGGSDSDSQQNALGDTWAWDGAAWHRIAEAGPPPRGSARLAFDGRGVILFGGRERTPDGYRDLADTWRLTGRAWVRIQ
jgi:hypothetical protein